MSANGRQGAQRAPDRWCLPIGFGRGVRTYPHPSLYVNALRKVKVVGGSNPFRGGRVWTHPYPLLAGHQCLALYCLSVSDVPGPTKAEFNLRRIAGRIPLAQLPCLTPGRGTGICYSSSTILYPFSLVHQPTPHLSVANHWSLYDNTNYKIQKC